MSNHDKRQLNAWAKENNARISGSEIKVKRQDERNIARAIQEFKRVVTKEVIKDIRDKEYYESKGTIRRREKAEQRRRHQKLQRDKKLED